MAEQVDREELYLLRVQDKGLAERLRAVLRLPEGQTSSDATSIELEFTTRGGIDIEGRSGELRVGGDRFPVRRQDLPTVVECFKSYDNVNLVKSGDVGQVIVVADSEAALPEGSEARHGVTPPMRDAVKRRFRKPRPVTPALMRQVEEAALVIAAGMAPEGYQFIDEEEEYIVAPDGRSGSWQPYQPGRVAQTPEPTGKKAAKRKPKKKGESADPAATGEDNNAAATGGTNAARNDVSASHDGGDMMSVEDI